MTPRAYVLTFCASAIAVLAAIPLIGNSLPGRAGTYVPMHEGRDVIRDEFVKQHALKELTHPCVGFFGDSRTAFNISAKVIDDSLPSGCSAQNYGFASLALTQIKRLLEQSAASDTVVISVSETMLESPDREAAAILGHDLIRYLYLGHQRFINLLKRLNRTSSQGIVGWSWSSAEKRWHFLPLRNRVLATLVSTEHEVSALAVNYFSTRDPDQSAELRDLLHWAAARTRRLIVVLPPSAEAFQTAAERFNTQHRFWRTIRDEAQAAGAVIIDCSRSCVDQSGFGDAVHLNDAGVRQYSRELAARVRAIMDAR